MGRPFGSSLRLFASAAIAIVLASRVVACSQGGASRPRTYPSSASPEPSCSVSATPDCVAWDNFGETTGKIKRAPSGQRWRTWGLFCPGCSRGIFTTDGDRASLAPSAEKIQIWLATVETGRATGIRVDADITMSPTPLRANAGIVALFEDRENFLTCKIEVSELHPDGLITIGDQRDDLTTSRLAPLEHVGLESGQTYHVEFTVPDSLSEDPVRCEVSGERIERAAVEYRLTPANLAAYGNGTAQGLRIHIADDEDDGGSTWDGFEVRSLA